MINKDKIAYAIEDSFVNYLKIVSENGGRPFIFNQKIGWVKTDPTAWSNFIFYANFDEKDIDEQISMVYSGMKSGELPLEWVVGPKSYPRNIGEYLEKHNIKKIYSMAGMAIDLTKLCNDIQIPENVQIEMIDSIPKLKRWAEVVSKGLWNDEAFESCLFESLLGDLNYKFYLAYISGEAVASSMLMLTNGVAEINMVSTIRQYQGLGIGTAMTTIPLLYAREQGYKIGVLQASQAGESVYRKIGFEEYCRFHIYRYQDEEK